MNRYPKRLIEVDLPIKRISENARREKSIRHGHISTLHIWWARRPLAACRAVICAALWPDPADPLCPDSFREAAKEWIRKWANNYRALLSPESLKRFIGFQKNPDKFNDNLELRYALLDFIADFSNWDNSTRGEYLETSRALTQTAHEALGGMPGTKPLVVDPFAGGGSIPLEALRVGADAFASDLNPVAVLLNKVVLEYIPKYGQQLANEVRKWGEWIKKEAEKELAEFYPKDPDGATPIAYLWARTIRCEGPGCGAEVPLIRSLWLAKKGSRSVALRMVPNQREKRVDFEIIQNAKAQDIKDGTVRRGSATCPCCGFTTQVDSVRRQLKERKGGTADAVLLCIVTTRVGQQGRFYRLPNDYDIKILKNAAQELKQRDKAHVGQLSLLPNEPVNPLPHSVNRVPLYGMETWGDVFTPRQALMLSTFSRLVHKAGEKVATNHEKGLASAIQSLLALVLDKQADLGNSLNAWEPIAQCPRHLFGRQAIPMVWDFAEGVPLSISSGSFKVFFDTLVKTLSNIGCNWSVGQIECSSATAHPLPDSAAQCFFTDPPYYDMISYADLSDFFYVWLRRTLNGKQWESPLTPKAEEIIVEPTPVESVGIKDVNFYLKKMTQAMSEGQRILSPGGIGVVVFAHKSTSGWEAQLQAMMDAGWIITGSWPIDTEMATKVAGIGQSRLMSSVHLVCRPRQKLNDLLHPADIGDWRDILAELPTRIHEWMPRLSAEGVVGADAIFACLGPALEIFSRYSRVEKASGEQVTLREYLEHVWATVSREALNMIFKGADATGFEEDARLTAMWLWTLSTGVNGNGNGNGNGKAKSVPNERQEDDTEDEESPATGIKVSGFVLEYDAARKIAQGLGAHLEHLTSIVEVKGDKARLMPVSERTRHLFGKDEDKAPQAKKQKKKTRQLALFVTLDEVEEESGGWGEKNVPKLGITILDRIHQSMILFAAGRGEALKRFLVEKGVGRDQRFWRLAQALSALYPAHCDEKRWVDGVLARKKGLGF